MNGQSITMFLDAIIADLLRICLENSIIDRINAPLDSLFIALCSITPVSLL